MNRLPSVFDTNSPTSALLISTLISRHAFGKTLDHYQILVSDETVAEFDDVTGREKFETYVKAGEREAFEEGSTARQCLRRLNKRWRRAVIPTTISF